MKAVTLQGFNGIKQAQNEWCWAAAAASIYNWYGIRANPGSAPRPQCKFIRDQIKGTAACLRHAFDGKCLSERCPNPVTSRPEHLNLELQKYGLLRFSINCDGTTQSLDNHVCYGGFDWHEVRTNIDDGCPIGLRVMVSRDWLGTISHFLVIIGYYPPPAERVVIWDPFTGRQDLTLDELTLSYGPLEQKYLTKQANVLT